MKIREDPLRPLQINIDINNQQSLFQKKTDTGTRARLGAENVSDVSSYNLGECGARGRGLGAESRQLKCHHSLHDGGGRPLLAPARESSL